MSDEQVDETRCPDCGARTTTEHPAIGGGGEVTSLCENVWHRRDRAGRETYDRAKNALRSRNLTMMNPGEDVGKIVAEVLEEGDPGTGPGSAVGELMQLGSVGAGGFIPDERIRSWPEVREEGRCIREEARGLRMREGDQPLPAGNDLPVVHELVIEDLRARLALGVSRYGQPLQPFNGRSAARDAYEEVLDLAVYLRQALYEAEGGPGGGFRALNGKDGGRLYVHAACGFTLWWHEPSRGPIAEHLCAECVELGWPSENVRWETVYVRGGGDLT